MADSGWYGLLDILKSGQQEAAAVERQYNETYCPNDGITYRSGPNGQLYCPFDGYRPGITASS
jgi:hypothetical protein